MAAPMEVHGVPESETENLKEQIIGTSLKCKTQPLSGETSAALLTSQKNTVSPVLLIGSKGKQAKQPFKTFRPPPSSVLSRVQAFLPAMAKADADLQLNNTAGQLDIENTEDTQGPLIEMNLALVEGDFESGSDCDTDSDESNDSDVGSPTLGPVTTENINISKEPSHKPVIEELDMATDQNER